MNEGLVQVIGQLLLCHRSSSIINHSVVTITNLSSTSEGQQVITAAMSLTHSLTRIGGAVPMSTLPYYVECMPITLHSYWSASMDIGM